VHRNFGSTHGRLTPDHHEAISMPCKVSIHTPIGVGRTTVVFPAPLMTTIGELGSFLARENAAAGPAVLPPSIDSVPSATG
jgi:hypothetical protein